MRLQSTRTEEARGADAYFTPPAAIHSLIALEASRFPEGRILEPCAGDGAIASPLKKCGYEVVTNDLHFYGYPLDSQGDYLADDFAGIFAACVTNPPYRLAVPFLRKALGSCPYVAFLLRTNFLESTSRYQMFQQSPPARVLISSRRLPMMHQHGYTGPKASSNTCYAWFIWDKHAPPCTTLHWFDWAEHWSEPASLLADEPASLLADEPASMLAELQSSSFSGE